MTQRRLREFSNVRIDNRSMTNQSSIISVLNSRKVITDHICSRFIIITTCQTYGSSASDEASRQMSRGNKKLTWSSMELLEFNQDLLGDYNSLKILAHSMFQNYFLISCRRHKCFVQFLYIVLPYDDVSIFLTKPFRCIIKQGKWGNSKNETLSFGNR